MNTHVLLDHEPVADGGYYARAVLVIEGTSPDHGYSTEEPGRVPRSIEAANRLAARNVRVMVSPGRDAEFVQMRHTFESKGLGSVLTISVGDVHCLDRIRLRMEALVGGDVLQLATGEACGAGVAEVARVVVVSQLRTVEGPVVETVELPILLSRGRGGWVRPAVTRRPLAVEPLTGRLVGE
ncbi:MAG: hypothetical protein HKN72_17100 [Gemmatimonadetes bacterium]|nr:hypothetical protein [Gemmatimonadota bacterium]